MKVTFRPLRDDDADYRLLWGWLSEPEVARFYHADTSSLAAVRAKYRPRVAAAGAPGALVPLLVLADGAPAGYLQYYPVGADYELGDQACLLPPALARVYAADLFLGVRGQGVGARALALLARRVFAEGGDAILIDPAVENHRAVRCYEKAGFRVLGRLPGREVFAGRATDSLLMILQRPAAGQDA